jgi:NHLM bacteriocin system ABC transporter ATP-binding protein
MNDSLRQLLSRVASVPVDTIPSDAPLSIMARTVGYRLRRLKRDEIQLDSLTHHLLAATEQGEPLAIVPTARGPIRMSVDQPDRLFTAADLVHLQTDVFALYAIFPPHALRLRHVIRFMAQRVKREIVQLGGVAIGAGALSLLIPLMTGHLFETAIPLQDHGQLFLVAVLLAMGAIGLALFQLIRELLSLRIQGRLRDEATFALWDRLMSLSPSFVRPFTAGDLVERLNGFAAVQNLFTDGLVTLFLAGLLCLFNGVFMAQIDVRLAALATVLTLVAMVVSLIVGLLQVRFIRKAVTLQGHTTSYTLQVLNGLAKLKSGGALERAYAEWVHRVEQHRHVVLRARTIRSVGLTFNGAYPILASMVIFAIVWREARLDAAHFMAFNVAYTQFLITGLQLAGVVIQAVATWPVYERLVPLLAEPIERSITGQRLETLKGHIQVEHVTFAYGSRRVLEDVSLEITPGAFVALVGAYGSGKSTLLRLLLGFETPQEGTITYDGVPLERLDLESIRRQWGVVLQNGQVLAGDLYQNINIFGDISLDNAWEAARLAGLADDIHAMPMGLFTYVGEGGVNLSGGQRQRLLLARALAAKPRVLFLDEATSALDEKIQTEVIANLASLQITRFVIAHRLSTVRQADWIYVMDQGRIVEQGTFDDLVEHGGVFARLMQAGGEDTEGHSQLDVPS